MKFRIENRSARIVIGLKPGQAKEFSAEDMSIMAAPVARAMSPMAQVLVPSTDAAGQPISDPKMRPARQNVHCFLIDEDGKDQEMSAQNVLDLFKDAIAADKARRLAAHKERLERRRRVAG